MRIRWCGWASNPVGGVNRSLVGSTPANFRPTLATGAARDSDLRFLVSTRSVKRNDICVRADRPRAPFDIAVARRGLRLQDCSCRARRVAEKLAAEPALCRPPGWSRHLG